MLSKSRDGEFINFMHQNAKVGAVTIAELLKNDHSPALTLELSVMLKGYKDLEYRTAEMLTESNMPVTENTPVSTLWLKSAVNLKQLTDKSDSHIAEMVIKGSTMGIIDMSKKLKEFKNCSASVYSLGEEMLYFETECAERLRKYL